MTCKTNLTPHRRLPARRTYTPGTRTDLANCLETVQARYDVHAKEGAASYLATLVNTMHFLCFAGHVTISLLDILRQVLSLIMAMTDAVPPQSNIAHETSGQAQPKPPLCDPSHIIMPRPKLGTPRRISLRGPEFGIRVWESPAKSSRTHFPP